MSDNAPTSSVCDSSNNVPLPVELREQIEGYLRVELEKRIYEFLDEEERIALYGDGSTAQSDLVGFAIESKGVNECQCQPSGE